MTIDLQVIMTGVFGTLISGGIMAVAVGLNRLSLQVAVLTTKLDRFDHDVSQLTARVNRLHDEHAGCPHCNGKAKS